MSANHQPYNFNVTTEIEQTANQFLEEAELKEVSGEFFKFNSKGEAVSINDYAVYEYIKHKYHICIIGSMPFIYDNGVYERDETGSRLKGIITECLLEHKDMIKSNIQERIYKLFLNDPALQYRMDQMNNYPAQWIVFDNCIYDPISKQTIAHDPKYRAINKIRFKYDNDFVLSAEVVNNSSIYKWLSGLLPEADDLEMLLEYLGYCLTIDTEQQKFLMLHGIAGSGKSLVIRAIGEVVGSENMSSQPLEKLSRRFATYNLLGKLVNSCGDISTGIVEDASTLKQVLGEDLMQAEAKGKDAISFKPYAKLLFSANGLPTINNEDSAGFYRRVLIANCEQNFDKVDPGFFNKVIKPDLNIFVYMIVRALEKMYERGVLLESQGSKDQVEKMWEKSDPVKAFLKDCTKKKAGARIQPRALYDVFDQYRFRIVAEQLSPNAFYASMESKGYKRIKSHGIQYFVDIELKGVQTEPETDDLEINVINQ